MRRFKKNNAVRIVIVPPHGRVHEGDVLEGDEYAAYAPMYLTEILPDGSVVIPPAVEVPAETSSTPALVEASTPEHTDTLMGSDPVSVDVVDSAESPEEATLTESAPPKKKGGRPRKQA